MSYPEYPERRGEHVAPDGEHVADYSDRGPAGSPVVSYDDPPAWQQYRKALYVFAVGLLATLTELYVAINDGLSTQEKVHLGITFLSTLISAGGAAAIGNVYSRSTLESKLAQSRRR